MVMTVELTKAHIDLEAHPLSTNIYGITETPRTLISRPSRNLQLVSSAPHRFGPECPLKLCWIRLSRNNQFVQDHEMSRVISSLIPPSCGAVHGAEGGAVRGAE